MKKNQSEKKVQTMFAVLVALCLLLVNSSLAAAGQGKASEILFIVGNAADESPISGVEIEICRRQEDGTVGEKVGNFTSRTEKSGDGHISVSLDAGEYCFRVVSEAYRLTGEGEWENFSISGEDTAVLLWVAPVAEEMEIADEEIAEGAPKAKFNQNRTVDEIHADAEGDGRGFGLYLMKFLDISNNVWMTLGLLAGLIAGVIGLDFILRLRKR